MEAGSQALVTVTNHWLARFEAALSSRDAARLQNLFHSDSHWRDVLALTWYIQTVSGGQAMVAALLVWVIQTDSRRFAPHAAAPRDPGG